MDTVTFLEQLANNAHHKNVIRELINQQKKPVRKAVANHDGHSLKKQLNGLAVLADISAVTQA